MARISQKQSSHTPQPLLFPGWARIEVPLKDLGEGAYRAGAALAILTACVRADAPFAGAWRRRLALKAAAAALRMARRGEDEAMLRDAFLLCQAGDDPGPAGKFLRAWRRLDCAKPLADQNALAAAADLGLRDDAALRTAIAVAQNLAGCDRGAPFAAAATAIEILALRPDSEIFATWLADAVLAARLKWPLPLPLIAGALQHASLRIDARGRRPHPHDASWMVSCCIAYGRAAAQACDLFSELARRAEKLQSVAPSLRAKGAAAVVAALLDEDALLPSRGPSAMSDRGLRRLFDRLVALGAIRELSGRSTFRLYGL